MKKLLNILISIMLISLHVHASDDFDSGGWSNDTTSISTSDPVVSYEAPVETPRYSSGDTEIRSTNIFGGDQIIDSTVRESSSGSAGWSGIGVSLGQISTSQSVGALFINRDPRSLVFDLDGNGVRGDMMDGLLFNLMFPEKTMDVTSGGGLSVSQKNRVSEAEMQKAVSNLAKAPLPLSSALSDGRKEIEISEAVRAISGTASDIKNSADRAIALESVLRLIVLNPNLSTNNGPVVTRLTPKMQELRKAFETRTGISYLAMANDFTDAEKTEFKGSSLSFEVSSARFLTALTLTKQAQFDKIPVTETSKDALRASLYALSFEMKRMKISESVRSKLVSGYVTQVAEVAPELIETLGAHLATQAQLDNLKNGLFKRIPVSESNANWGRQLAALGAAATVTAGWMAGGSAGVDLISSNVGVQNVTLAAGFVALPVVSYVLTRIGLNKWIKRHSKVYVATETDLTRAIKTQQQKMSGSASHSVTSCLKFYGK